MQIYALRLTPGQDLRQELEAWARQQAIAASYLLAAVGSLQPARLRLAGQATATLFPGPVELIALNGLLSQQGTHLHGAIADAQGRVYGGHIVGGCLIYTTAELVLGTAPQLDFQRELDPQTGYPELKIRGREAGESP